jgi:hypothetical protein
MARDSNTPKHMTPGLAGVVPVRQHMGLPDIGSSTVFLLIVGQEALHLFGCEIAHNGRPCRQILVLDLLEERLTSTWSAWEVMITWGSVPGAKACKQSLGIIRTWTDIMLVVGNQTLALRVKLVNAQQGLRSQKRFYLKNHCRTMRIPRSSNVTFVD